MGSSGGGTVVNSPRLTLMKSAQAQAGFFSFLFLFQDPVELQVSSEGANPWTIHSSRVAWVHYVNCLKNLEPRDVGGIP